MDRPMTTLPSRNWLAGGNKKVDMSFITSNIDRLRIRVAHAESGSLHCQLLYEMLVDLVIFECHSKNINELVF